MPGLKAACDSVKKLNWADNQVWSRYEAIAQQALQSNSTNTEGWGRMGMIGNHVFKFNTHFYQRWVGEKIVTDEMKAASNALRNELGRLTLSLYNGKIANVPTSVIECLGKLGIVVTDGKFETETLQGTGLLKRSVVGKWALAVKKSFLDAHKAACQAAKAYAKEYESNGDKMPTEAEKEQIKEIRAASCKKNLRYYDAERISGTGGSLGNETFDEIVGGEVMSGEEKNFYVKGTSLAFRGRRQVGVGRGYEFTDGTWKRSEDAMVYHKALVDDLVQKIVAEIHRKDTEICRPFDDPAILKELVACHLADFHNEIETFYPYYTDCNKPENMAQDKQDILNVFKCYAMGKYLQADMDKIKKLDSNRILKEKSELFDPKVVFKQSGKTCYMVSVINALRMSKKGIEHLKRLFDGEVFRFFHPDVNDGSCAMDVAKTKMSSVNIDIYWLLQPSEKQECAFERALSAISPTYGGVNFEKRLGCNRKEIGSPGRISKTVLDGIRNGIDKGTPYIMEIDIGTNPDGSDADYGHVVSILRPYGNPEVPGSDYGLFVYDQGSEMNIIRKLSLRDMELARNFSENDKCGYRIFELTIPEQADVDKAWELSTGTNETRAKENAKIEAFRISDVDANRPKTDDGKRFYWMAQAKKKAAATRQKYAKRGLEHVNHKYSIPSSDSRIAAIVNGFWGECPSFDISTSVFDRIKGALTEELIGRVVTIVRGDKDIKSELKAMKGFGKSVVELLSQSAIVNNLRALRDNRSEIDETKVREALDPLLLNGQNLEFEEALEEGFRRRLEYAAFDAWKVFSSQVKSSGLSEWDGIRRYRSFCETLKERIEWELRRCFPETVTKDVSDEIWNEIKGGVGIFGNVQLVIDEVANGLPDFKVVEKEILTELYGDMEKTQDAQAKEHKKAGIESVFRDVLMDYIDSLLETKKIDNDDSRDNVRRKMLLLVGERPFCHEFIKKVEGASGLTANKVSTAFDKMLEEADKMLGLLLGGQPEKASVQAEKTA